uniref:Secreted protein n=1 Tax=Acanthochromis polyacanthus TaxID=80966 RepID=A0A3Q1F733_9TELE
MSSGCRLAGRGHCVRLLARFFSFIWPEAVNVTRSTHNMRLNPGYQLCLVPGLDCEPGFKLYTVWLGLRLLSYRQQMMHH